MQETWKGKNILVTGGAGFIGSHLSERLVGEGAKVTVVDNLITGNEKNLEGVKDKITFINEDVVEWSEKLLEKKNQEQGDSFEYVFHLASPASPRGYYDHPIETYRVNSYGTERLALLSLSWGARMLYASTSEAYGDPKEHPQKESYWGNVNPIGKRACYDESKRFGEMVMTTLTREKGLDARVVRIFNTYGPRMDPRDGRVFPNFIMQALHNEPMTVHGDGTQTRSFCFVSDLVEYMLRVMASEQTKGEVVNIGNPDEHTIHEMAEKIKALTKSNSEIIHDALPEDDPTRRQPDITKAQAMLNYTPSVGLDEGLTQTIAFFGDGIHHKQTENG